MLDLVSEVMRSPGSIPTGGNILSLDFFHVVKPLIPILPLLPILSICEKLDWLPCEITQFCQWKFVSVFHLEYHEISQILETIMPCVLRFVSGTERLYF